MMDMFLVPFAGGTSMIYDSWEFSKEINPIQLDYRGHGFRMKEPLYNSFEDIIVDFAEQVEIKSSNEEISIFGHSMGGLVAWDLSQKLIERGYKIRQIYISGCLPPHLFNESLYRKMATDEWLLDFLAKYSRISSTRMESKFFKKHYFPLIKNDYRLISTHKHEGIKTIKTNLACFYGIQDRLMPSENMYQWNKYTTGSFLLKGFNGEHFFIENSFVIKEIIETIENTLG